MDETGKLAAICAFLQRYSEDQSAGAVGERATYTALWPQHAEAVGREFDALAGHDDGGEDDGEMRIGAYRVLRELGRGGQATVYLARDERLQRDVALKVLPRSFASAAQEIRLQREAMTAARLDDSGICPVYEVGQDGGHSFLAMRFVPGETLAARIERARRGEPMPWRAVCELFERLCGSLQRAHTAGIVHRDIKPGNVMLADDGQPVLLDFGMAVEADGSGPLLTRSGDLFGTPAYLPPERLLGQSRAADVRWDLWAVGICLFEALALRRPFDEPTLDGLYRAILTRDAPPLRSIARDVPKDLAAVVAVCLEKSPERRYQTAADLAADLRAVRLGEAIRVRPPGFWRRFLRWHVRNATIATGAWLLLVALGVVIGVQRTMLREVTAARDESQSINDFLVERMLLASTPREARGAEPTAGQVLDAATSAAAGSFPASTRTAGTVYHVLGRAHDALGRRTQARAAFERAVAIRTEVLGPDDRDTLRSRYHLAQVMREVDDAGAEDEIRATLRRQAELFGEVDDDALDSRLELSRLLDGKGRNADAHAEVTAVISGMLRTRAADDRKVLDARITLGHVLVHRGQRGDAESIYREVLEVRRRIDGVDSVIVQQSLNELSNLLRDRASFERIESKWAEAEVVFEESVALARKLYKSPDSALATPLNNFGVYWQDRARLAKTPADAADFTQRAAALFRESLAMREESDGPDSKRVAIVRNNLGMLYLQQKMYSEALVEFDKAIAIRQRIDNLEHSDSIGYLQNRAYVLLRRDGPDAAVDAFADALARLRKGTDREPRFVSMVEGAWLRCLLSSSRAAEGLPVADEVYQRTVKFWSAGSREAQVLADLVAKALRAAGRGDEAGPWDERAKPPSVKGQ